MIFSFARSLDVSLLFEDRTYRLGETIEVTVELKTRRDVKVRKGRVDLVYDVKWTSADTDLPPLRMMHPGPGGRTPFLTYGVPKRKPTKHRHSYVLGSSSFLDKDPQPVPDIRDFYNIGLRIHKDDPPYSHLKEASMGWSLVVVVDVARATYVMIRKHMKITLD